ncbi:hypothetical protein CspeluHIS016_0206210 [Cutaneotrichosporon spelunceum]|uniref:DNA 3'-5' helicase n=1 Tax=Cutaneotrichosporon spelunceum TaxID=1672016 RepID=A0AAD3YA24_9TREE|nr:hypothetical protein CspeluHIS016_0206210 [Cutaneotrichosporon spelunceum]
MAPLAPRNNLDSLRNSVSSYTPTALAPAAKPVFQLARAPDLSGMKEVVKIPPQSAPMGRTALTSQPSPAVAASAPARIGFDTSQSSVPAQTYSPKLDQLPIETINAMLIKQMESKMALMEKRERLLEGDPDPELIGEDADLIKAQINLLTSRIAEIKTALAARDSQAPSSSNASRSQILTPTHPPRNHPGLPLNPISRPLVPNARPQPEAGPSRRMLVPDSSPPPDIDERDIEMAEEGDWDGPPEDLPKTPTRRTAPPLRKASSGVVVDRAAALAEFNDVDVHMLDSSPPRSPERSIRVEGSTSRAVQRAASRSSPNDPKPTRARPPQPGLTPRSIVKPRRKHGWSVEIHQKLRQVFKINMFRTNQEDAIDATMAGKDVFVLMPTGGGKSLTYQLPAICVMGKSRGVTFVISPLISLINDQTRHLAKRGVPAIAYTGDMTAGDKHIAHAELSQPEPNTKVVYVTPEMMSKGGRIKGIIRDLISRNRLARFVVDEAHCFRDDYLRLDLLRKDYPNVPIMALTATAAEKVQADIKNVLGIHNCVQIQQSFNRPNLYYEVRPKQKKVMNEIASFIAVQPPGASGIIYCSSREKCEVLASELRTSHGIQAWHYHAGMSKGDRRKVQEGWQDHKFAVIVATIAFGMGIDKPDVRYVIHHSLPRSLEGYYQETGRAGRDGDPASCILFYSYGDSKTVMQLIDRDQELNAQQRERQKNALREVLRFCNNKTDCRRSQVLAFFNEEFDAAKCQQTCDVCADPDKSKIQVKDVTDAAKLVLTMMKEFGSRDRITLLNAVDCFRGTNGNSDKCLGQNPHFGVGKDWDRTEAERLTQNLLLERALEEFHTTNGAGWNNTYLKLGKEANAFLNGNRKLSMDFREASPKKARASKAAAAGNSLDGVARLVPLAQRKRTSKNNTALARKRSRQEVLEDQQDFVGSDDDPDLDSIEDADNRESSGIKVVERVNANRSKRPRRSGAGAESASEQCLNGLRKLRAKALQLPDETLQTIAAMMPSSRVALGDILTTDMPALYSVEGLSRKQADLYGTKILGVTTNFVQDHRAQEAPNAPAPARWTLTSNVATGSRTGATLSNLSSYAYQVGAGTSAPVQRAAAAAASGRMALAQPGPPSGPRF